MYRIIEQAKTLAVSVSSASLLLHIARITHCAPLGRHVRTVGNKGPTPPFPPLPRKMSEPGAFQYIAVAVLICFSGLFSGLTLGLMGLDKIGLEIVIRSGEDALRDKKKSERDSSGDDEIGSASDPEDEFKRQTRREQRAEAEEEQNQALVDMRNAKKIQPLRDDGNLLLCTLLLGNVAVNTALSILMAQILPSMVGGLVATVLIVIFGEILPQALCSRHALRIGAASVPIVQLIKLCLLPATKPLALALDKMLGDEIGTIHTQRDLKQVLEIHKEHSVVDAEQQNMMEGAISYKEKEVRDVMTPVEKVKLLSVHDKLDFRQISAIFRSGYSRLPITGASRDDIKGLLFTKDLIFVDPEHEIPVKNYLHIFDRQPIRVYPDEKLGRTLQKFKQGK